jgi:hypothetical protein
VKDSLSFVAFGFPYFYRVFCRQSFLFLPPHRAGNNLKTVQRKFHEDRSPARAASRRRILSSASGFIDTGPHTGGAPTRNSRSTARSFSRLL